MKTKSKAYLKVEEYRDQLNQGRSRIVAKDLSCVVYYWNDSNGRPCSINYTNRAKRPCIHSYYKSEESRTKCINRFIKNCMENSVRRKPEARALEVGDILRSSWGYDQTNIDYFVVLELVGKCSVKVAEIGQKRYGDGFGGNSKCVPDVENIIGEPVVKKCDGTTINSPVHGNAYKVEPEVIAGVKIFNADYWSADH